MSILPLENKIALVTGASGGIGSAVAKRLAQEGVLTTPKAGFINGESLTVDGGWSP